MSSPVGSLVVRIASDTSGLTRGGRQAQTTMQRVGRQAQASARRVAMLTAALAAAGTALAANLVRQGMQAVDEQAKLARQLDATIGGVRGLELAANDAGIETNTMRQAVERLNARLGEAQRGTGTAAAALERLGLSASQLAGMDVDERMATLADRMRDMGLSSSQVADELRQLGIRQGEITLLMQQGGDAIRAASREVDALGLNLSAIDAAQVEAANDAMNRIGLTAESVRAQIAVAVSPVIRALADEFHEAAIEAGGWGDQARDASVLAIQWIGRVIDVIGQGISAIENNPLIGQLGLVGFALFGRRGLAAGALIGGVAELFRAAQSSASDSLGQIESELSSVQDRVRRMTDEEISQRQDLGAHYDRQLDSLREQSESLQEQREEIIRSRGAAEGLTGPLEEIQRQLAAADDEATSFGGTMTDIGQRMQMLDFKPIDPETAAPHMFPDEDQIEEGRERVTAARAQEEEDNREHLERMLEQLRAHLRNEEEVETHAHEERMERLQELRDEELVGEEEFLHMKEDLQEAHEDRMAEIRDAARQREETEEQQFIGRRLAQHHRFLQDIQNATANGWAATTDLMTGELENMTQAMSRESRAMFEINKIAGIANSIISTHEGITKALTLPFPQNLAAAAVVAARGFASVAAIKSQSFSSSGSATASSAGGGGSAAAPPGPADQPGGDSPAQQPITTIHLQGEVFGEKQVRALLERINDGVSDGGRLRIV